VVRLQGFLSAVQRLPNRPIIAPLNATDCTHQHVQRQRLVSAQHVVPLLLVVWREGGCLVWFVDGWREVA